MIERTANEVSHLGPRQVKPYRVEAGDSAAFNDLAANLHRFGIGIDARDVQAMMAAHRSGVPMLGGVGMDADLVSPITTPSINTPIQFLQEWLPGFVYILTQARKIDDLIGLTTQGRWEDEEVVQGILERIGDTRVYGDNTNIPMSSWNTNFETRTVVRFEEGMSVGRLEEARAARMRIGSAEAKRSAAAEALEITRNFTGFFGFNDGTRCPAPCLIRSHARPAAISSKFSGATPVASIIVARATSLALVFSRDAHTPAVGMAMIPPIFPAMSMIAIVRFRSASMTSRAPPVPSGMRPTTWPVSR